MKNNRKNLVFGISVCILVTLFFMPTSVDAKERPTKAVRYQGELFSGYNIGLGKKDNLLAYDRVPLHLLNGVKFNESLFFGVGVGLNMWTTKNATGKGTDFTIPVYLNFKWYVPGGDRLFKFFLGADMGGVISQRADLGAMLISPMLGVRIRLFKQLGLTVSTAYIYEGWVKGMENAVSLMLNSHAVAIRAGFTF